MTPPEADAAPARFPAHHFAPGSAQKAFAVRQNRERRPSDTLDPEIPRQLAARCLRRCYDASFQRST